MLCSKYNGLYRLDIYNYCVVMTNKKVLIVEDDSFFREAIRDFLKKKYMVYEAPNGKSAKEILSLQSIDVVISDVQMPSFTGLELLEWSKQHKPVPFIMMTGFSMLLETKSAFELGAKGFIAKPFRDSELLAVIDEILGLSEVDEKLAEPIKKDYCKVSIDEFVAKPKIDFDVYIKLSESKILKLAHKGQELPKEKLTQYKQKGLKFLYILKEDFSKLISFNIGLAKLMKDRSEISEQKKMQFLKYTGEVLLERTFIEGIDKESLQEAKDFLDLTMTAVKESEESMDLLQVLSTHSDHVYAHSLGVSMYVVILARKLGIESSVSLFKLSLAGLFHDVGKKEIDREILDKPRHLVSKAERAAIEGHVVRGQEILNAMKSIPSDVVQIVLEHHEDQQGLGFPMQKHKFNQHPLAKILQCANIFIELTLPGPNSEGKTAEQAILHIEKLYAQRVDPACLQALRSLFKI